VVEALQYDADLAIFNKKWANLIEGDRFIGNEARYKEYRRELDDLDAREIAFTKTDGGITTIDVKTADDIFHSPPEIIQEELTKRGILPKEGKESVETYGFDWKEVGIGLIPVYGTIHYGKHLADKGWDKASAIEFGILGVSALGDVLFVLPVVGWGAKAGLTGAATGMRVAAQAGRIGKAATVAVRAGVAANNLKVVAKESATEILKSAARITSPATFMDKVYSELWQGTKLAAYGARHPIAGVKGLGKVMTGAIDISRPSEKALLKAAEGGIKASESVTQEFSRQAAKPENEGLRFIVRQTGGKGGRSFVEVVDAGKAGTLPPPLEPRPQPSPLKATEVDTSGMTLERIFDKAQGETTHSFIVIPGRNRPGEKATGASYRLVKIEGKEGVTRSDVLRYIRNSRDFPEATDIDLSNGILIERSSYNKMSPRERGKLLNKIEALSKQSLDDPRFWKVVVKRKGDEYVNPDIESIPTISDGQKRGRPLPSGGGGRQPTVETIDPEDMIKLRATLDDLEQRRQFIRLTPSPTTPRPKDIPPYIIPKPKQAPRVTPAIGPSGKPGQRQVIKGIPSISPDKRSKESSSSKTEGATRPMVKPEVSPSIRNRTRGDVEANTKTRGKTGVTPATQLEVKPKVITPTKTRTTTAPTPRTKTPPPIKPRPPRDTIPPPKPTPPPLPPPLPDGASGDRRKAFKGAVAFKQGIIVIAIKNGGRKKDDLGIFSIKNPPEGLIMTKGPRSAYKTIRRLYGNIKTNLALDMGIMDIGIHNPPSKAGAPGAITFTPDPKQKTTGDLTIGESGPPRELLRRGSPPPDVRRRLGL
jgi:hypothetical protein